MQVLGLTFDKPQTHRKWAARHRLKMPFIDDRDRRVSRCFGTAARMGGVKLATVLIDPDGTLRKIYSKVKAKGHAATVLEDCRQIWG